MANSDKIIGVNGFGRIGRYFTKLSLQQPNLNVAVVNDLAPIETLAHLFKYDSVHGGLKENFTISGNTLVFDSGKKIVFTQEKDPANIPWSDYGVEYVLESTGLFLTKEKAASHLK
jgi:glyceraldehyde 3-phosphate dehydrogenase